MHDIDVAKLAEIVEQAGYPTNLGVLDDETKEKFYAELIEREGPFDAYEIAQKAKDSGLRSRAVSKMFSKRLHPKYSRMHDLASSYSDKALKDMVEEMSLNIDPWIAYQIALDNEDPEFAGRARTEVLKTYGVDSFPYVMKTKDSEFIKDFIEMFRWIDKEKSYRAATNLEGDDHDPQLVLDLAESIAIEDPEKALKIMDYWYEKELIIRTGLACVNDHPVLVYQTGSNKGYSELIEAAKPVLQAQDIPKDLYICGRMDCDRDLLKQASGRLTRCIDEYETAVTLDDHDLMRDAGYGMVHSNQDRAWWIACTLDDEVLKEEVREWLMYKPKEAFKFARERTDPVLLKRAQNAINAEAELEQSVLDQLYSS